MISSVDDIVSIFQPEEVVMVSIIVPVYNVEHYLSKCVKSVLSQTFGNFELILVDNGSTDHSAEICRRYAKCDERVIFLQIAETGVSAARNAGLEKASGEYISFVDADDWLSPSFYEEMMRYAGKGTDIICCDYKTATHNASGIQKHFTIRNAGTWRKFPQVFSVNGADKYNIIFARSPYIWNKIFTRSVIGHSRFREDLDYGEDMLFLLEVLKQSRACGILNRPLYYYRKNRTGSITGDSDAERDCMYIRALQEAYRRLKNTPAGAAGVCRLTYGSMAVLRKWNCHTIPRIVLHQVRQSIGVVSRKDRCVFLTDSSFPIKGKLMFILLKTDPRIAVMVRQMVNKILK